jgi:hypothetical protein
MIAMDLRRFAVLIASFTSCTCKSAKREDVASMFSGSTVSLPAEIAKVPLEGKHAEVVAAIGDPDTVSSKIYANTAYAFSYYVAGDRLYAIAVRTNIDLIPVLTRLWGIPVKQVQGPRALSSSTQLFWFSPETELRAWVDDRDPTTVTFSRYEPMARLLGGPGFAFPFAAAKPLLGATLDELDSAWGDAFCDATQRPLSPAQITQSAHSDSANDPRVDVQDRVHRLFFCVRRFRFTDTFLTTMDELELGNHARVARLKLSLHDDGEQLRPQNLALLELLNGTR